MSDEEDILDLLNRFEKGEVLTNRELNRLGNWIAGITPKIGFGPSAQELHKVYWRVHKEQMEREKNRGK